jgi:predicted Zn-dependent protease
MARSLVVLACLIALPAAAKRPAAGRGAAAEAVARADAWVVAGRCEEAVPEYQKAVKLDGKNGLVKVRLATCLARLDRRDEAVALLEPLAAARPPVGPAALGALGDLHLAAGDLPRAADAFTRLAALTPTPEAKLQLVEVLYKLAAGGDARAGEQATGLAEALVKEAVAPPSVRRRAEEITALIKYGAVGRDLVEGRSRLHAGDAKGAAAALERVVAARPELEEAQYLLGMAYASPVLKRKGDARKAWQRAAQVKEAQLALGLDAFEGGDLAEARKRLEQALALDQKYQAAHYHLGLVLREGGDSDGAKQAWRRAALIDGASDLGRWANTKLAIATGQVRSLAEGQVIDTSAEISLGHELVRQVEERFGRIEDPDREERLNKILRKLAQVSDRPEREMRYRVALLDVGMVNALTLPGGTVLVFRGLLELVRDKMGDTEDAWAAVLAHECSHAALRHGLGMIQVASSLSGGTGKALAGGAGELAGLLNTVSRAHEFEADQFGVLYAYRAGYDPAKMLDLLEQLRQAVGEIPRGMTHPQHGERIERVRDYLLELRAKVHVFELGTRALAADDHRTAAQHFEVFLGVFPDSPSGRSNLGVALHRQALAALGHGARFRKTTDIDPRSGARKIELRAAAEAKPDQADAHLLREAVNEYRAVLAEDAAYAPALTNLGAALDDLKDHKGARAVLERAVRLSPSSKGAWNNLGAVAAESGDTARALEALEKAAALDGKFAEAWFNLALAREQAGKAREAGEAWDRFLALDGKSGWAQAAREHRQRLPLK